MSTTPSARGFTLIEMIVSVGLFAVVMLIATSAYFTLIRLDRRARATNQVVNNLSFAMDAMARGIRTGVNYHCLNGGQDANGNSTSGSCTQFYYTDSNLPASANIVTFYKSGSALYRYEGSAPSTSGGYALTDPAITITSLAFYVRGNPGGSGDDAQPQVLFVVNGTMPADSSGSVTTFTLEEAATQRLVDL